jgi:pyruvate kinase
MRRQRRTKVVATLGPASSDRAVISRLFEAGADVFRINMSHTNHERMRELVATIRSVEAEHRRPIGILVDLQGPKLRLGAFAEGSAEIAKGRDFILDADPAPGDATRVQLPHPEIFAAIKPGDALLIDDGKLRLVATEVSPQRIVALVEVGGKVSNRKGVTARRAGAKGHRRPRSRPGCRHRLDRAVVYSAPGGYRRSEKTDARPRRSHGQDREAASGGAARRHP